MTAWTPEARHFKVESTKDTGIRAYLTHLFLHLELGTIMRDKSARNCSNKEMSTQPQAKCISARTADSSALVLWPWRKGPKMRKELTCWLVNKMRLATKSTVDDKVDVCMRWGNCWLHATDVTISGALRPYGLKALAHKMRSGHVSILRQAWQWTWPFLRASSRSYIIFQYQREDFVVSFIELACYFFPTQNSHEVLNSVIHSWNFLMGILILCFIPHRVRHFDPIQ